MCSISLSGRASVFSTSRKEESVFIPDGAFDVATGGIRGGGGGGGGCGNRDGEEALAEWGGGAVRVLACLLRDWSSFL